MILENLITEFKDKPDEEIAKLIMAIRASRRVSKKPVAVAKKKASVKNTKQQTLDINSISPGMAAMLLQKLRGGA